MKMHFASIVGLVLPLIVAEKLVIPAVEEAVNLQLAKFSEYYVDAANETLDSREALDAPAYHNARGIEERQAGSYWYETIAHQGISAFNDNPTTYKVYRNVKDYGAKGDGTTDDTAAIQRAISDGNRCAPGSCASSSTTNALVYFPAGIYLVSSSIVSYYATHLVGNPNNVPTLKATAVFNGFGVIDGAQYQAGGALGYGATNIFWRQIKNFVIDVTAVPAENAATGIHWPTSQATSLKNIVFKMSSNAGTQHQGLFIEDGSGGFMSDLTFYGGKYGAVFGNQQFTVRNISFYNAVTAINQIWNWGWTFQGILVSNCTVGLDMATRDADNKEVVGSATFFDSSFIDTKIAFNISRNASSTPRTGGSLAIENVSIKNVGTAVQYGPTQAALLAGTTGSSTITSWITGQVYHPNGPNKLAGPQTPVSRPASLLSGGKYYQRSKPSYGELSSSSFLSVRAGGAKGDGKTDDTAALQRVITAAAASSKVVYFDAGTYKVTSTIFIPAKSKIVGEAFPAIMSSGSFFNDINSPKPVVQVANPGEYGIVEWSDMIVSTQGAQAGAVMIQWNLASPSGSPSAMWDVHTRIGGTKGSGLSYADCPATPSSTIVNNNCRSGNIAMHVTTSASNLYMENVWLWSADHDVDDPQLRQITVYTGRGLLVESKIGNIWLVGTSVEHHARYQYQFRNTQNIYAGQMQTETPYYQPNPSARFPFPLNTTSDPNFDISCPKDTAAPNCAEAWGLVLNASKNVLVYGAGLYSFFSNYNTSCSATGATTLCQQGMVLYDAASTTNLRVYGLNTIGAYGMIYRDTVRLATYDYNINVFPSSIISFSNVA
ncbi:glycoside hydrolase family 55 protein [Xylaria flabelliformis]|nr:glycoside hydrolase family 55 protein [Xylaria flabelliformis]